MKVLVMPLVAAETKWPISYPRAIAVNNLLAVRAVAQDGVCVALRSAHFILAELDHADFLVKRLRVLDCLRELSS